MFTTPCFIRKNTPELIQYLRHIGYHSFGKILNDNNSNWIYCFKNKFKIINPSWNNNPSFETNLQYVDCKKNERLFKAISALRDDSDYMQWFVSYYGCWILCKTNKADGFIFDYAHKASLCEIIKHFNE